ncbi:MAG: alpha/beta hydrolase [Polyangiaceae bacterium]|nr:alpha/beta hydrolase [Polyangiaceae bacterium]
MAPDPILNHQLIAKEGSSPERWLIALHGIFGMGQNFRSLARALTDQRPDWGVVLVDLRGHGTSQGFAAPNDLAATVSDLDQLIASLGRPVGAILGHSFGGKVALAWLERHPNQVQTAFILDSMPGARVAAPENDTVAGVLETLESVKQPLSSREEFKAILRDRGYQTFLIEWLAMNLRPKGDAFSLRLDLPGIRSMLTDYWQRDLWPVVENPASAARLVLVIGGRSHVYGDKEMARARAAQEHNPGLEVKVLPKAAHWIQVDDPEGVLDAVTSGLP